MAPRSWLVLLALLGISPWLAFAGYALWSRDAPPEQQFPGGAAQTTSTARSGPWGQLLLTPITISPPIEFVPRTWGPVEPPVWAFPGMTTDQAVEFLMTSGMPSEVVSQVRQTARGLSQIGGVALLPSMEVVRGLAPEVRARVYLHLAHASARVAQAPGLLNFNQYSSYRYQARSVDEWMGTTGLSPATRALIDPLFYRHGDFLYFADMDVVRSGITDPEELQLLAKRLLRHQTVLVSLQLNDPAKIEQIVEYWGRGGRRTDIRPLLESIARWSAEADDPSVAIDISHLLPSLVRQLLYRYPKVTVEDTRRPLLANCLWTALNFFGQQFDDRYLDVDYALNRLAADYFIVSDGFQLGDVVVFTDAQGNLVHAAVHLADGLVFSKNGTAALAPWSILPLESLKGHYPEYSDTWRISYHRRKDL